MAKAIMFDRYGEVHEPSDLLYHKNVLPFRGSFRPITYLGFDMLKTSYGLFKKDESYEKDNTIAICELTLSNLLEDGNLHERDFLDRVDILNGMGQSVMVSNFKEYYRLVSYFSQFRIKNLRIVISMHTFSYIIDEKYYVDLKGGLIEAFGRLFTNNMKLYIYPSIDEEIGELITTKNFKIPDKIKYLFLHLVENRQILDINDPKISHISTYPHVALNKIKNHEKGWELMVPKYIEDVIKNKKLFGYTD